RRHAPVPPAEGPGSSAARRDRAADHDGEPQRAREGRQGADRLREGPPGQAQFRLVGDRRRRAPHDRALQADRRGGHGARPVQGHGAGNAGGHGERHPDPGRHAEQPDAASALGEAAGARHVLRQAPARLRRRADPRRGRRPGARILDLGAVHGPGRDAERDRQPTRRRGGEGGAGLRGPGSPGPDRNRAGRQYARAGEALPRRRNREVGEGHHRRRSEGGAMRKLVCILAVLACGAASAQQYPNRPLHYIVPFPPGAFNDALARTVAAELPKAIGQPVLVENRPGGNTIIGTEAAAKSPADGYTLFGAALPFSVVQSLYKTSFDVTRDFAPITLAGVTPNLLVANPKVPVSTVGELLAYARANPGKLNYASTGNGSSNHLSFELFKSM